MPQLPSLRGRAIFVMVVVLTSPDRSRNMGNFVTASRSCSDEVRVSSGIGGDRQRAAPPARLRVNSVDAAVAAAVANLGIVRTLSYQVADHVAEGRLKEVLPDPAAPALPISLLFQSGRKDWPTIRAFVDVARRHLSGARL